METPTKTALALATQAGGSDGFRALSAGGRDRRLSAFWSAGPECGGRADCKPSRVPGSVQPFILCLSCKACWLTHLTVRPYAQLTRLVAQTGHFAPRLDSR